MSWRSRSTRAAPSSRCGQRRRGLRGQLAEELLRAQGAPQRRDVPGRCADEDAGQAARGGYHAGAAPQRPVPLVAVDGQPLEVPVHDRRGAAAGHEGRGSDLRGDQGRAAVGAHDEVGALDALPARAIAHPHADDPAVVTAQDRRDADPELDGGTAALRLVDEDRVDHRAARGVQRVDSGRGLRETATDSPSP